MKSEGSSYHNYQEPHMNGNSRERKSEFSSKSSSETDLSNKSPYFSPVLTSQPGSLWYQSNQKHSQKYFGDELIRKKSSNENLIHTNLIKKSNKAITALETEKIFENLLQFLDLKTLFNMQCVSKQFVLEGKHDRIIKRTLKKLIIKGFRLNNHEQYEFWDHFLHFSSLDSRLKGQYERNCNKVSDNERDITFDLDRTFSEHEYFHTKTNEKKLQNVLRAISHSLKDVGYFQGLSHMVGVFLIHDMTEQQAYFLVLYMLKKLRICNLIRNSLEGVRVLNYQLEVFLKTHCMKFSEHMDEVGFPISLFSTQWFATIFTYDIPLNILIKVWNLFFIKGPKILIRTAVALISLSEDEILKHDSDDMSSYMNSFVKEIFEYKEEGFMITEEKFFKKALQIKVTNRSLRELEQLYKINEPMSDLVLVKKGNSKHEWDRNTSDKPFSIHEYLQNHYNEKITVKLPNTILLTKKSKEDKPTKNSIKTKGNTERHSDNTHQRGSTKILEKKNFIYNMDLSEHPKFHAPQLCKGDEYVNDEENMGNSGEHKDYRKESWYVNGEEFENAANQMSGVGVSHFNNMITANSSDKKKFITKVDK